MKILIIEDDREKKTKIIEYLKSLYADDLIVYEKESLRSALKEIIKSTEYDLMILDMSLPNFDISEDEPGGGTPESFAGKELLAQMKLRRINIPVIVVTQFSTFDHGRVTLDDLKHLFEDEYSDFYLGSVYYNDAVDSWKYELVNMIDGTRRGL